MNDPAHERAGAGEAAPRQHATRVVEAAFACVLAALLCWNAWPWLVALDPNPSTQRASGALTAVLVYGLAGPAIAAALVGAQQFFFARLGARIRLGVASTLLLGALLLFAGALA